MSGRKADPEYLARLAYNLRRLRIARQLTQERLGKLCGLQKNYISDLERGRFDPRVKNFQKLTRGLGCSADELLREIPKS
jgi:transcriptional regulator with XRE-family HTH domain